MTDQGERSVDLQSGVQECCLSLQSATSKTANSDFKVWLDTYGPCHAQLHRPVISLHSHAEWSDNIICTNRKS